MRHSARKVARRGFSLIEVAIATAIIGIGVTAVLTAVGAGTRANKAGRDLTTAGILAQEVREWTLRLPFSDPDPGDLGKPPGPDGTDPQTFVDDLDDLMGVTFSPPRDGLGQPIYDLAGWSQSLTLTWRNPGNLSSAVTPGSSDVIHVQVVIKNSGQEVLRTGWLVTRRQ